ncbi:MAG: cytochrome c oxidase subunit 3 [Burkholderiales bacterium]|nr:cytochrome c oxidase subunit 3 [Burkholderiales bacterium]
MSIFQQLTVKPWLTAGEPVEDLRDREAAFRAAQKLALRVFLAVVTVLFLLLVIAYGRRMAYEDWRPTPQLGLLWANTFALILSSVAMQWAQLAVRRGQIDGMRIALIAGGAFTVVFLIGQVLAWRQLGAMEYFKVTNPAIAFFYLITGLHGLHLLGGLVAWGRAVARAWDHFDVAKMRQSVELCTVYWHFLLAVWLVLFGLLFSGNNLDILLTICGIR